jgi:type I restriction-modification system DNA methylase subunit
MCSDLTDIINHIRNSKFDIEKDRHRIQTNGEVFTPTELVNKILDRIPSKLFVEPERTFIDPNCGDGQFLGEVLIRKLENGISFEQALSTIYGIDIMEDNVDVCRKRLLCGRTDLEHIVKKNIVCHDSLNYDYSFNGTNKNQSDLDWHELFKKVDSSDL